MFTQLQPSSPLVPLLEEKASNDKTTLFNFKHKIFTPLPIATSCFQVLGEYEEADLLTLEQKAFYEMENRYKPSTKTVERRRILLEQEKKRKEQEKLEKEQSILVTRKMRLEIQSEEEDEQKPILNIVYLPSDHIVFQNWFVQTLFEWIPMSSWVTLSQVCRVWRLYKIVKWKELTRNLIARQKKNCILTVSDLLTMITRFTQNSKRNFDESIDLSFHINRYDPVRQKRFDLQIFFPNKIRTNGKYLVFGDEFSYLTLTRPNVIVYTRNQAASLQKNRKNWKSLLKGIDYWVTTAPIYRMFIRIAGTFVMKYPHCIVSHDELEKTLDQLDYFYVWRMRRKTTIQLKVGSVSQGIIEIAENVQHAINEVAMKIGSLRRSAGDIKFYAKTTMGKRTMIQYQQKSSPYFTTYSYSRRPFIPRVEESPHTRYKPRKKKFVKEPIEAHYKNKYQEFREKLPQYEKYHRKKGYKKYLSRLKIQEKKKLF